MRLHSVSFSIVQMHAVLAVNGMWDLLWQDCGLASVAMLQESHINDTNTFEKYRDTPPISIAILWQKYALLLAESSTNTTSLYHDTPPICIAILFRSIRVRGRWNTPNAFLARG